MSPENKYVRETTITIVELVPQRDNLPDCTAWQKNGTQCPFKARYEINNNPACGIHVGSMDVIFMPVKLRRTRSVSRS